MIASPVPDPVLRLSAVPLVLLAWVAPGFADDAPVIAFPRKDDLSYHSSLACSADGKLLIVVTKRDPTIIYGCDTQTGEVRYRVEVPETYHGVSDFAWPPNSERMWIVTSDWHKQFLLDFNPVTGEFGSTRREFSDFGEHKDEGSPGWVRASTDGQRYLLGLNAHNTQENDIIKVYDANTHAVISRFVPHQPYDGARALLSGLFEVDISPDGRRIVTSGSDRKSTGVLKSWDADTGTLLAELRPNASLVIVRYAPDGEHIVSGGPHDDGFRIKSWPVVDGTAFGTRPDLDVQLVCTSHGDGMPHDWRGHKKVLALSHDESMAFVACPYFFRVCSLKSGRLAFEQGGGNGQDGKPLERFSDYGVALSPDGKHLWLGNDSAEIHRVTLPDVSGRRKLRR